MALFQDHPIRSVAAVAIALFMAHVMSLFVSFFHVFHLTQTSVAILAVSGVIFLITMHHRRDGHLLTQTQEEMVLVFCFGLFWMALLLGWRAAKAQGVHSRSNGLVVGMQAAGREGRAAASFSGQQVRPYPCSIDDAYCIVEEYTFF
ncbi:hypothetical protein B0H15DRAFT_111373 [Mycena belliarum]|uniref:Uncharacterized protein n=1 Tax=Mycena belliarum TaxID=1033014 RepID=A0AAD6U919_9AGAR|nr:hypothetical protein B0H15DRAFT_111373 [Mycena belliae]